MSVTRFEVVMVESRLYAIYFAATHALVASLHSTWCIWWKITDVSWYSLTQFNGLPPRRHQRHIWSCCDGSISWPMMLSKIQVYHCLHIGFICTRIGLSPKSTYKAYACGDTHESMSIYTEINKAQHSQSFQNHNSCRLTDDSTFLLSLNFPSLMKQDLATIITKRILPRAFI